MLSVTVEEFEQVAILHCSGRIVRGNSGMSMASAARSAAKGSHR